MGYFYGPVHSRRLGLSLGVDLFPKKICSFDCVYCQLSEKSCPTVRRVELVNIPRLKAELKTEVKKNTGINFITISGKGEPTLHKRLDKIIGALKGASEDKYPVCVITNSSLLWKKEVRDELKHADIIIPSLDAVVQNDFRAINKPFHGADINKIISGITRLTLEFKGEIWLEIMVVRGINDNIKFARLVKKSINGLNLDKIQLNIPIRSNDQRLIPSRETLEKMKNIIGEKTEIASIFPKKEESRPYGTANRQYYRNSQKNPRGNSAKRGNSSRG